MGDMIGEGCRFSAQELYELHKQYTNDILRLQSTLFGQYTRLIEVRGDFTDEDDYSEKNKEQVSAKQDIEKTIKDLKTAHCDNARLIEGSGQSPWQYKDEAKKDMKAYGFYFKEDNLPVDQRLRCILGPWSHIL